MALLTDFIGDLNSLLYFIGDTLRGKSTVSVTREYSTGTKVATVTVDSRPTEIYVPSGGGGGGGSEYAFTKVVDYEGPGIKWKYTVTDNTITGSDYATLSQSHFLLNDEGVIETIPEITIRTPSAHSVQYTLELGSVPMMGTTLIAVTPWNVQGSWSYA